jgi:hypothetical protein
MAVTPQQVMSDQPDWVNIIGGTWIGVVMLVTFLIIVGILPPRPAGWVVFLTGIGVIGLIGCGLYNDLQGQSDERG